MTKHNVLSKLEADLLGVQTEDVVEIGGHKFGLRVLTRAEEHIARALIESDENNVLQALADSLLPQIALAITQIDGAPTGDLWPAPVPPPADPVAWRGRQVFEWLRAQPGPFVEKLVREFVDAKDRARERLEKISSF